MTVKLVRDVVILGGGTAGWMTAAALARALHGKTKITVVEPDEIGTVGVGEATIPLITQFHALLGIDEDDFMRATQATIKLGIEFWDWARIGDRYMHGFGRFPNDIKLASFEQVWQRAIRGGVAHDLPAYSITKVAAYQGKFTRPRFDVPDSPLADIAYAFHFDASLYAKYLRKYSEDRGVRRIEGKVVDVIQHESNGKIDRLVLASGQQVKGEFFVDCSGFRGRLIEDVFHTGYEDWTHWLPCDRAIAVPVASPKPTIPYTQSKAQSAGWQWRIPLQHRSGNGYVFSSKYISEDEATATLLGNLDGEIVAPPRTLRFVTGRRRKAWQSNCVAIGLSSGFLEPLESTSIRLIQSGVGRLLHFFPSSTPSEVDIDAYNRLTQQEFEHVRDFIILHYHATRRNDSPFWNYTRTMPIPESLQRRIELFQSHGRVVIEAGDLFVEGGWIQVMFGQGLRPKSYQPILDVLELKDLSPYLEGLRRAVNSCVASMPTHDDFIASNCKAGAAA